jgi:hypothetical protein
MPQLGLGISPVINRSSVFYYDPDALSYLAAVEAADGQSLETSVKTAINNFILGCKADAIWNPIVGCCIMAGARTVAGSLVPLKGNSPTNNNFVSGDYSRTLGLVGDASTKYISTNYNNTDAAFPQDNTHISCYVTQAPTLSGSKMFIGQAIATGGRLWMQCNSSGNLNIKNRSAPTGGVTITGEGITTGFKGHSRDPISGFTTIRSSQTDTQSSLSSTTLVSGAIAVFNNGASANYNDARMSFYSIGTNINLTLLDSRLTTLMSAISAALS